MSTKYINATVIKKNQVVMSPVIDQEIDCNLATLRRVEYLIPRVEEGVFMGYQNRIIQNVSDAPPGAIRTIRMDMANGDAYWVFANNNEDVSTLATLCNECCDGPNSFIKDHALVPVPVDEEVRCSAAGTAETFNGFAAGNPFGGNYTLNIPTHDGGQAFVGLSLAGGGYTSTANLATALNTQIGSYGTWSAPTTSSIRLVSTTVKKVHIEPVVLPKTYCLALPSSGFNGIFLVLTDAANNPINVPITSTVISRANVDSVLLELQKHALGTWTKQIVSTVPYIQYSGQHKPQKVTDSVAGTNHADFASGAC